MKKVILIGILLTGCECSNDIKRNISSYNNPFSLNCLRVSYLEGKTSANIVRCEEHVKHLRIVNDKLDVKCVKRIVK